LTVAALPEDDVPTMSRAPGETVGLAAADGDPTAAELEPPADDDEEDDRTVQQQVGGLGRPPLPPRPREQPTPATSRAASSPARASPPPAAPSAAADVARPSASVLAASTASAPSAATTTAGSGPRDASELDEAESVTATAPRIQRPKSERLPLVIPGSVQIRTVEHDELLDETEVRTEVRTFDVSVPLQLASKEQPGASSTGDASAASRRRRPRPAAGSPAVPGIPVLTPEDEDDESVTAEAPAPRVATLAAAGPASSASSASSAAGSSAAKVDGASSAARSVPRLPVLGAVEGEEVRTSPGVEEPPTRPGVEEPPTRPGGDPPTSPAVGEQRSAPRPAAGSVYDTDDSVTARNRPVEYAPEDSVTTQAPAVPASLVAAVKGDAPLLDDITDGTTQKVKKGPVVRLPADSEAESITTQAPGPLTNILRVIAAEDGRGSDSEVVVGLEDEPPENRTAVMPNAPLKRALDELTGSGPAVVAALRPTGPGITLSPVPRAGGAAAAAQLQPASESGLRVTALEAQGGDRASLGALGIAEPPRPSGVARTASPADAAKAGVHDLRALVEAGLPLTSTGASGAYTPPPATHEEQPDGGRGPRYGLLVAVVAIISLVVPLTLFFVLNRSEADGPRATQTASEAAKDFQLHDAPRAKLDKSKPTASASGSASALASASGSASGSAKSPPRVPPRR